MILLDLGAPRFHFEDIFEIKIMICPSLASKRKKRGGQEEDQRRTRAGTEGTREGREEDEKRTTRGEEEDKNNNGREKYDGDNS